MTKTDDKPAPDRLTALVALKEAVEAGGWGNAAKAAFPVAEIRIAAYRANQGDMNAALSLLAAVLPGRTWSLTALMGEDGVMFYRARIYLPYAGFVEATASNEARALLLAIIAAKIEEERNGEPA